MQLSLRRLLKGLSFLSIFFKKHISGALPLGIYLIDPYLFPAGCLILEYNILSEDKKIKGLIGEIIAAKCLKKKGFIVYRPSRILRFLEEVNAPDNYEVQFLRRYQKTMDFFAVLPGP